MTGASDDCVICLRSRDKQFVVFEDEHWLVRHSNETNILGYLLIESKRHFLDLAEAEPAETNTYGTVLSSTMKALHTIIDCPRIYSFSLGEAVPHYHLHLIPRTDSLPKAYRARGIMQYPLKPVADEVLVEEVCRRLRNAIARLTYGTPIPTLSCR